MLLYLYQHQTGRRFLIGTSFLWIGIFLSVHHLPIGRFAFYMATLFLGYDSVKHMIGEWRQAHTINVDLLMILAAIGSIIIGNAMEAAILLFIFSFSNILEEYAMRKSGEAIAELMEQVPQRAQRVLENGQVQEVDTKELRVGDCVLVAKGMQVPIDGYALGNAYLNTATLTGESLPQWIKKGEEVFAGTINEGNVFCLEVTKTEDQTVFAQVIQLVREAQGNPSPVARWIDRFEKRYVPAVLVSFPLTIGLLMILQGLTITEALYRGLVFLTVASPCALVASVTPATLSAISNGARHGILFKGGEAIENLGKMDRLFSDKTGTLTDGKFSVVEYAVADETLLEKLWYMERASSHPISKAICRFFPKPVSEEGIEKIEEIPGQGLRMGGLIVGAIGQFLTQEDPHGYRENLKEDRTYVFIGTSKEVQGYIALKDRIRKEVQSVIHQFQTAGLQVALATGDQSAAVSEVAQALDITETYAGLLPQDKLKLVKQAQARNQVVGMIGDGINDAPALAQADIGIAMGTGASIAVESADVILVKNDWSRLFYSYQLSKKLYRIIHQNIFFALAVILLLICLNIVGILPLPLAVLCHEGSTILVILNGLRLLFNHPENTSHRPRKSRIIECKWI